MPLSNFTNEPIDFQEPTRFTTKKLAWLVVGVVIIFILTIGVLMATDSNKTEDSSDNTNKETKSQSRTLADNAPPVGLQQFGEVDLPAVDQVELGKDYQNNLQGIIAELDQEIMAAGGIENVSVAIIQEIKAKAMQEVLPRQHQIKHLEFILILDMMMSGNAGRVQQKWDQIKGQY